MERRWISVKAASEYLSVHQKTCYRLIDKGEIPATKIGGSIRVDLKALETILESKSREVLG